MSDLIQQFTKLFRGRGDVRGSWHGRCIREPLTAEHFEKHLTSDSDSDWMGVYPHLGSAGCSWGCIDIDGKDFRVHADIDMWDWPGMHELASNLVAALAYKNVHGHIEQTRNGYHVWIFPTDMVVPAETMRRALMAACVVCQYRPNEVNPKQEHLPAGKVGNYVRLPYYGALNADNPDRYFVDATTSAQTLTQFLETVQTTATTDLEETSLLWTPPTVVHEVDTNAGLDAASCVALLDGLSHTIWRDGPLEGSDRSSTLAHLAHLCSERGLTQQQAYTVIVSADLRWGKFQPEGRADAEEQLLAITERAYA